ncbi:type II secretion system F family protein [Galenea microaerophila]
MDLGLVLLMVSIMLPFVFVLWGVKVHQAAAREAQLDHLMQRAGMRVQYQAKIQEVKKQKQKSYWRNWLEDQFKHAGIVDKKTIQKWLLGQVLLICISIFLLALSVGREGVDKMIALAAVLPLIPAAFLFYLQAQRQKKMRKQFPEMLDGLIRGLQAGYGVDGALNEVAEMLPDPLGSEIKEIERQFSIGINMRDILMEFQKRVNIPEANFFVVTLIIQRETGGQLTQILQELSKLMRRREVFQMKLKTLTAESRFTAWFLGLAPMVYLAYKYFFDYESMKFFLYDPTGQKLLWVSLTLIAIGTLVLRQLLKMRF